MTCGFKVPAHFPHNCPPEPHTELPRLYFRLVYNPAKVTEEDFKSRVEQGGSPSGGSKAHCLDCAVSLLDSVEKARNFVTNHPAIGPKHIAEVELRGGHGVVQRTGDPRVGHFNWWIPEGVSAFSFFRGVIPE